MFQLKSHSMVLSCLLFACNLFSQSTKDIKVEENKLSPPSKLFQTVIDAKNFGTGFTEIRVMKLTQKNSVDSRSLSDKMHVLQMDTQALQKLMQEAPQQIALYVPSNERELVKLLLVKFIPFADGFNVYTSSGRNNQFDYHPGLYYRGVVEGNDTNSVATFSFFENEIMGSFTFDGGNMIVQPDYTSHKSLILYNDKDISGEFRYQCLSDQLESIKTPILSRSVVNSSNCVRVYIECDYALFQNKGSVTNTINWISSVFNNVASLYANENINTVISEIYVWNTPDSYSKVSSVDALNQFKNLRPSYNGDIAHLAALGGSNLGGVAWVDALCSNYGYAYSNISSGYSAFPNYSWTIEVMTHEMGHNLGSNHTQWCGWVGGALDNCYTTEGGCPPGPAPINGGTIMSYCHLTSYGINFNKGFGQQPGDKIRSRVQSSTCLSTNCTGAACNPPNGISISNITASSASASWSSISNALSYSFEYKLNSSSTWTAITTSSTNINLTGLTNNTIYNTRVKTNCSSGSSAYSGTTNFTTGAGAGCGIPSNVSSSNVTQTTAVVSWNAVPGATNYLFQYKLTSGSVWSQIIVASPAVNMTGMSPGVSYTVRIQAICGNGQSDFSNILTIVTSSGYCISKGQSTTYEWIKKVSLGSINRISGPDGGYFDATNLSTDLLQGETYTINYQCGNTGNSGTLYWKIWIDFNNNNSFDDANELIVMNASPSTGVLSSSFVVPANASIANVRFRVAMKYGGYPSSCLTYSYGEVEDYSVNIKSKNGIQCDPPSGLGISNITQTNATANWNLISGVLSYSFEYKLYTDISWNIINTVGNSCDLSGLSSNSIYNCRIKSICDNGAGSYSSTIDFNTEVENCEAPLNLNIINPAQTTATANWNAVVGANSYEFEYKASTDPNWIVIHKTNNSHDLSSLLPNTIYNTRVQSNCSSGSSPYSPVINFTTKQEICIAPSNISISNVTISEATINWNSAPSALAYYIDYKKTIDNNWSSVSSGGSDHTIAGLSPVTQYDMRMKSVCSFGESDYSGIIHFTTKPVGDCQVPKILSASSINQNSAVISWDEVVGAATYSVQYKLASANQWLNATVAVPVVKLTGLQPASNYQVRISSVCDPDQSEFSSVFEFTTLMDYCTSRGLSTTYEWIKRVKIGNIDRNSGKDNGYFDGTAFSTDVAKGTKYTINYQCGSIGSSGILYWRIWVDYNKNNSFDDAGEMVMSVASSSTELLNSSFTIPAGAVAGDTRMRVAMKYGGYPTACLQYSYGEVEDYTLNIVENGNSIGPIEKGDHVENLDAYPNPFNDDFNLLFHSNDVQEVQLAIHDQLGRSIYTKAIQVVEGVNKIQIHTADFIPATYLIQLKTANNIYWKKIIKIK